MTSEHAQIKSTDTKETDQNDDENQNVVRRFRPEQDFGPFGVLVFSIIALSFFSILGEALRVFIGDFWGGQCTKNDGSWLYTLVSTINSCVTSSGGSGLQGGAIFQDLPANMLGCFIMGLIQPGQDLGLTAAPMPMACFNARHPFQRTHIFHLGLRTGFCGSLTTFASWNTQMVVMMYGGTVSPRPNTQLFSALMGYIVGLEASMSSLVLGQNIAIFLHRATNPELAEAEDLAQAAITSDQPAMKPYGRSSIRRINQSLPDFERRYLDGFLKEEEVEVAKTNAAALEAIERWKETTEQERRDPSSSNLDESSGSPRSSVFGSIRQLKSTRQIQILQEVEQKILVEHDPPVSVINDIARDNGWDIDALKTFADMEIQQNTYDALSSHVDSRQLLRFKFKLGTFLSLLTFGLMTAFLFFSFHGQHMSYYRTLLLSALFAPPGTLIRWQLAALNGKVERYKWFPLGTFVANIVAAVVSAAMAGVSLHYQVDSTSWGGAILAGIKTGFAGSLSTVSTFVTEGDRLRKTYPHHAKHYYYLTGSLAIASLIGLIVFVPMALTAQLN